MRLAFALVLLAACSAADLAPAPPTQDPPPILAGAPQATLRVEAEGRADGFTLATRQIDVTLGWEAAEGRRVVFEVYAPGETTYQREVRALQAKTASFAVPIAGTYVSDYGLSGDWEVRVYAEGETLPIASAEFTVRAAGSSGSTSQPAQEW